MWENHISLFVLMVLLLFVFYIVFTVLIKSHRYTVYMNVTENGLSFFFLFGILKITFFKNVLPKLFYLIEDY